MGRQGGDDLSFDFLKSAALHPDKTVGESELTTSELSDFGRSWLTMAYGPLMPMVVGTGKRLC